MSRLLTVEKLPLLLSESKGHKARRRQAGPRFGGALFPEAVVRKENFLPSIVFRTTFLFSDVIRYEKVSQYFLI